MAALQAILAQGADPNTRDVTPFQEPVLACAALQGQTAIVRYLLDQGADVNATDVDGETPLMYAACRGHRATVQALLDAPALRVDGGPNAPQLFRAALRGDLAAAHGLLAQGSDANAREAGAWTALMGASALGYVDVVDALLEHGASVDAKDASGSTALMWAAKGSHADIADTLLGRGADVNAKDTKDVTALMWAASSGHVQVVQTLLAAGADVKAIDKWGGQTALSRARRQKDSATIQVLLDAGARD
jgi:ankyrin repeat protein